MMLFKKGARKYSKLPPGERDSGIEIRARSVNPETS